MLLVQLEPEVIPALKSVAPKVAMHVEEIWSVGAPTVTWSETIGADQGARGTQVMPLHVPGFLESDAAFAHDVDHFSFGVFG